MTQIGGNSNAQLKSIIDRIEREEAAKKEISEGIKEIYLEAKSNGFDPKIIRVLIRERKLDAHQIAEREALLDQYRNALGMLSDLPLGQSAIARATA